MDYPATHPVILSYNKLPCINLFQPPSRPSCQWKPNFKQRFHQIHSVHIVLPLVRHDLITGLIVLWGPKLWNPVSSEKRIIQLSFLWCAVPYIGTTENGIRHEWNHDTRSLTSTSCFHFHWFLWGIAKLWCFLKIGAPLSLFDGIIETILMAFSWNIFQAYNRMFIFENNVFKFQKATKNTKCTWSSCSIVTGLAEQMHCNRRVCSIYQNHEM